MTTTLSLLSKSSSSKSSSSKSSSSKSSSPKHELISKPEGHQVGGQPSRAWQKFLQNRLAIVGLLMVLVISGVAVMAPFLARYDPVAQFPKERLAPPTVQHILGQDEFGRDLLARILFGTRVSLMVGILSVLGGGLLGTTMGVLAGYYRGAVESIMMRVVDALLAFPALITGLIVLAVLGSGLDKLIIAIAIVVSPRFARLAHGPTLALREKEYIQAAQAIGSRPSRIIMRHVLPNIAGELFAFGTLWIATAIRIEANLSFIGLGVSPPTPTWGQMIRDGVTHLTVAPWFSLFPGVAILLTALAFNLLGDGLRDALDPKLKMKGDIG
ncbi:MAG: ABC transporter permease [Chloroflexota bacterium]